MVYFSNAPVAPESLDAHQYAALKQFRTWCEGKGLISTYDNLPDFEKKFSKQLSRQLISHPYIANLRQTIEETANAPALESTAPLTVTGRQDEILSEEAVKLLCEAAEDNHGTILKVEYLSGSHIQTNGKSFGGESRRDYVAWEAALIQLFSAGLITSRGYKGEVFEVTDQGYKLADRIKNQ